MKRYYKIRKEIDFFHLCDWDRFCPDYINMQKSKIKYKIVNGLLLSIILMPFVLWFYFWFIFMEMDSAIEKSSDPQGQAIGFVMGLIATFIFCFCIGGSITDYFNTFIEDNIYSNSIRKWIKDGMPEKQRTKPLKRRRLDGCID